MSRGGDLIPGTLPGTGKTNCRIMEGVLQFLIERMFYKVNRISLPEKADNYEDEKVDS